MTWVRIDDVMPDHPKVAPLSDRAFRLHLHGLCYAARTLTDGFIPDSVAHRLVQNGKRAAAELVAAGIWTPAFAGYQVHEYDQYQETRDEVLERRAKTADRVARWRAKRGSNPVTNTVTNGVSNAADNNNPMVSLKPTNLVRSTQPQGSSPSSLTLKTGKDTPATDAAQQLIEQLPNATPGTLRRLNSFLRRGASAADFHDARSALSSKQPAPKNPAAWACGIIDERLKARQA